MGQQYRDLTAQQILKGAHFHEPTRNPINPERLLGRTYCILNALNRVNNFGCPYTVPVMTDEYKIGYCRETTDLGLTGL